MFPSKRPDRDERNNRFSGAQRSRSSSTKGGETPVRLYKPSIYTYTCYGMYFAASNTGLGSEGVCKGIKSKLEVIENDERLSRVEALQRFSTVTTDGFDVDQYDGELHQQAESTLMSPVLIFRNGKDRGISSKERLPEENTPSSQTWSCYGSTEVEYLVLQHPKTGSKTITAVAPSNTGVSVRSIINPDSIRTITRVGLGWLDIIHDSTTTMDANDGKDSNALPEEVAQPRMSVDTLDVAKKSLAGVVDLSEKTARHMEQNLIWLAGNLMDDFPSRTYNAGKKIVAQLPDTVERTWSNMGQIINRMMGDEGDDGYSGKGK